MIFGLEADKFKIDKDFDPVQHFDLSRCTVTIDTQATNMAMRNFPLSSWDSIKSAISAIPLSHPLWRVDPDLGLRGWVGQWHTSLAPQAPTPDFQIPLIPFERWFGAGVPLQDFPCNECSSTQTFATPGLLLRHYRDQHGGGSASQALLAGDPPLDLDAYWGRFVCQEQDCDAAFALNVQLRYHTDAVHIKLHKCDWEGCGGAFGNAANLTKHKNCVHLKLNPYQCEWEGCEMVFLDAGHLARHKNAVHLKLKSHKCDWEGCGSAFGAAETLTHHKNAVHLKLKPYECDWEGCASTFAQVAKLARHIDTVHRKDKSHKCD